VEDEAELQRLRGALLTLRIHGEEELQVECSNLGSPLKVVKNGGEWDLT